MTCTIHRCAAASGCTRHLQLALAASPGTDAEVAERSLAVLADALRTRRSPSPRAELVGAAAELSSALRTDRSGDPEALRLDALLERGSGAPIAIGALAVTAARRAGIALGLLAGPFGTLAVAHAMLSEPLVLDLGDSFALRDVAGREPDHRWLCAHETARRVEAALRRAAPAALVV